MSDEAGVVVGRAPSPDEVLYTEIGADMVKRVLPFVNEVLRQLVTLSATLAGGSAAFLSDALVGPWLKVPAVVCFLLALVAAFAGMLPYNAAVAWTQPHDVKRTVDRALAWKGGCLRVAAAAIVAGLVAVVAGLTSPK
jgi:hypothetical protein